MEDEKSGEGHSDINKTPISWGRGYKVNDNQTKVSLEELVTNIHFEPVSDNGLVASYKMSIRNNIQGENLKYFQVFIPCIGDQLFQSKLDYSVTDSVFTLNKFVMGCGQNIVPLSYSPRFYSSNIDFLNLIVSASLPAGFTFNFLTSIQQ